MKHTNQEVTMANIKTQMICIDCEEVFEYRNQCPACGSRVFFPINRWITPDPSIPPVMTMQTNRPASVEMVAAWRTT